MYHSSAFVHNWMQRDISCIIIRFEVITVVRIHAVVFWMWYLCSLVCRYDISEEQSSSTSRADVNIEAVHSTQKLVPSYFMVSQPRRLQYKSRVTVFFVLSSSSVCLWDKLWCTILALFGMFTGLLTHSTVMIRKQFSMTSSWAISHVSVELVYILLETDLQTLNINYRLTCLIVWEDFTEFSHSKSFKSYTEWNLLQCFPE
jgi:hypothetical protein